MKRAFLILSLFFPTLLLAQTNWDLWLQKEGYYLLSPEQKKKLKGLPDPEKELYINNLWASLDPNPITPENEFEEEYWKRFEYAQKRFGIPSDRAKIYILLGKPNSIESHPNSDKYYPLEVWSYYSLGHKDLPPSLDLIFFKRWGVGDYRLYSPLFDGFKSLTPSQIDIDSPRMRAQLKAQFDASVVEAARQVSVGYNESASEVVRAVLTDPAAMQRVYEKQRPTVETTVVYEGFEADVFTYSVPEENDIYRTSVAIAIPPKYLTFEKDGNVYQARIDLIGRITDEGGREILRISDSPAMKMSEAELERSRAYLLSYLFDTFLVPGKYNLNCLFRDYASNTAGKLEKNFEVRTVSNDKLELLPLLVAVKSSQSDRSRTPFTYERVQFYPKENSTFNDGQSLVLYTSLLNPKREKLEGIWKLQMGLKRDGAVVLETTEDAPVGPNAVTLNIARRLQLRAIAPGDYVAFVKITRGTETHVSEAPLRVSLDSEVLGRIRIVASQEYTQERYHTNIALQLFFNGKYEEAGKHARIALDFAPGSYSARSLLARIEQAKGNSTEAIASYEKLLEESPGDSEGFYLIGKWSMEIEDYSKAEAMMKKAISLGYYTTELLNNLADAELKLGKPQEAIDFWQKSLELNSEQPEIKKQIEQHRQ